MKTLQEKIDVMNHFLNGGEIEWLSKDMPFDIWGICPSSCEPSWDWVKYDYRIKKTPKFRLPTKEEFEDLLDNFSRWDKEKKGIEISNKKGDILFLPASGYHSTSTQCIGSRGYYWSSTMSESGGDDVYYLTFSSKSKYMSENYSTNFAHTIRLVSDKPFEGGVEFDGIWWKTENEPDYYFYDEALKNFNK